MVPGTGRFMSYSHPDIVVKALTGRMNLAQADDTPQMDTPLI